MKVYISECMYILGYIIYARMHVCVCIDSFFLSVFFSFLQRKKLTILIQHILELKFYIPLVLFGIFTHII
jgi:hypothetical protein